MIELVEPGPMTTVQDAIGRPGWRHLGVPEGGAADAWSARLANRLVGAPDDAALLEILLGGLALTVDRPTMVSLTGGLRATAAGVDLPQTEAWTLRPGVKLRVEPGDGARGYLAVGGGLKVEPVLGSASTDVRTGFGGVDGRPLRSGDRLVVEEGGVRGRWSGERAAGPIRIVAGPHDGIEDLPGTWTVGVDADRSGVRLDGASPDGAEVPSMGLPLGAVQIPPDGRPIVMLADRPVTGGYRVPACVIRADIGRVAQLRTGDRVRFASVSVAEACEARQASEAELAKVERVPDEDDPGWAGAHR